MNPQDNRQLCDDIRAVLIHAMSLFAIGNAVYAMDGSDYMVYHGYDAADKGRSKLLLQRLQWDAAGWPVLVKEK